MDFLTLYARYLDEGYEEPTAARLAGETAYDVDSDFSDSQDGWWD